MAASEATILSSSGDGNTLLWDVQTLSQSTVYKECTSAYRGIASIPSRLGGAPRGWISVQIGRPTIHLWHVGRDQPWYKCAVAETMLSVAVSPDGSLIATGGASGKAYIWDALSGELLRVWSAHYKGLSAAVFLPDGGALVTGGQDGIIHVWDTASLIDIAASSDVSQSPSPFVSWTEHSLPITCLRMGAGFRAASALVISASADRSVRLWHVPTKRCLLVAAFPSAISVADIDAAGHRLYAGGSSGVVYATDIHAAAVAAAAPDASVFRASAAAGLSGVLASSGTSQQQQQQQQQGRLDSFIGHTAGVTDLALSADGRTLVTGSDDTTVRVWDTRSGRQLSSMTSHKGPIAALLLLPKLSAAAFAALRSSAAGVWSGPSASSGSAAAGQPIAAAPDALAPLKKHLVPLPAEWRGSTTGPTGKDLTVLLQPHLPDEALLRGINRVFETEVAAELVAARCVVAMDHLRPHRSGSGAAPPAGASSCSGDGDGVMQLTSDPADDADAATMAGGLAQPAGAASDAEEVAELRARVLQLEAENTRWKAVSNTLLERLKSAPAAAAAGAAGTAAASTVASGSSEQSLPAGSSEQSLPVGGKRRKV